jgi:hypothetical protein
VHVLMQTLAEAAMAPVGQGSLLLVAGVVARAVEAAAEVSQFAH